eukprot:CAMPEP_0179424682 /NCGR_PEP_ID=MMETSP0799-20121207/11734_1 /TAXON_ID=46947 /ORGANISM="Geminigera cryophila, Strain CCMP2564" /LENGTH=73 /DNA_ID=CAMNT_0021199181 /DNA_START=241 /DNA_END=462 /DNA_ORIENTATION=-
MVVCSSNQDARELYEAGCSYCVQQDFLAAKEVGVILAEEIEKGDWFVARAQDHKDELEEEEADPVCNTLGQFI